MKLLTYTSSSCFNASVLMSLMVGSMPAGGKQIFLVGAQVGFVGCQPVLGQGCRQFWMWCRKMQVIHTSPLVGFWSHELDGFALAAQMYVTEVPCVFGADNKALEAIFYVPFC